MATPQEIVGCHAGAWWNGCQCITGKPQDLFPHGTWHTSWSGLAEAERWRIMPIPGKIPVQVATRRLLEVETLLYEVDVEYNFIIHREDGVNSEFWPVQGIRKRLTTGLSSNGPYNCAIEAHGSRNTLRTFVPRIESLTQSGWRSDSPSNRILQVQVHDNSSSPLTHLHFIAPVSISDIFASPPTARDDWSGWSMGFNDLQYLGCFLSAFEANQFMPRPIVVEDATKGIPRFNTPSMDLIREPLVPVLTSSSGSVATASSSFSSNLPWRAFSQASDWWISNAAPTTSTRQWLQVDLGQNNKLVRKYAFAPARWGARAPAGWRLLGSNDNSTWVTLDTRTAQDAQLFRGDWEQVQDGYSVPFLIPNPTTAYRYYRLDFDGLLSFAGGPTETRVGIQRFQLYAEYETYPPPISLRSVSLGGAVVTNPSSSNPLTVNTSPSCGSCPDTFTLAFNGIAPSPGFQVALYRVVGGNPVHMTNYSSTSNSRRPFQHSISTCSNHQFFWEAAQGSSGLREIEYRMYNSGGNSSYGTMNIPREQAIVWGSFWLNIQLGGGSGSGGGSGGGSSGSG